MIKNRIQKAIKHYNETFSKDISYESLTAKISDFKKDNSRLLLDTIWDDEDIEFRIYQYDMILMIYNELLNVSTNALLNKDIKLFYEDNYDIGIIYQLKLIYHDLLTLRNLFNQQFEAQFLVISRSVIEKLRILFLVLGNIEFGKKIIWNTCNYSSKDRYYKLYKQKKIIEKLRECDDQKYKNLINILIEEDVNDLYSLQSMFVHSDIFELIKYNIHKEKGINISPLKNASSYILARSDYMTEMFIILFPAINYKLSSIKENLIYGKFIPSYYIAYIDDMYK